MKKKCLCLSLLLAITLTGCIEKEVVTVNTNSSDNVSQTINTNIIGVSALIKIGNGLYYDSATGIVYWWNGRMHYSQADTTPTPYYSSNGFLYEYIPETNTLQEIRSDIYERPKEIVEYEN